MHDAVRVCGREGIGDVDGVSQRLCDGQAATRQTRGQRFAVQQLEDEERYLLTLDLCPTDVVDGADVRMRQLGDGARLAFESCPATRPELGCAESTLIATVRSSRVSRAR